MGVLGLAPFISKVCPELIRILPERLKGLSGRTIVIDGTLMTQRLHYAPIPHKHRHVLGWYRVSKELQDSNVKAICVFDGVERSGAKETEVERRRKVRRVVAARWLFEAERSKRLSALSSLSNHFPMLGSSEREEALTILHTASSHWGSKHASSSSLAIGTDNGQPATMESIAREPLESLDALAKRAGVPINSSQDPSASPFTPEFDVASQSGTRTTSVPEVDNSLDGASDKLGVGNTLRIGTLSPGIGAAAPPNEYIAGRLPPADLVPDVKESFTETLMAQYIQYQQSIPKFESLPSQSATLTRSEDEGEIPEYVVSKDQQQLTLEEGHFWEHLANCSTPEEAQSVLQTAAPVLAERSDLISQSYARRTSPPTAGTYEESKEILQAMGVPCIDTTGPFEAEALASSLVLNGHADYVASEDSDVIIYEAPLIRNLSNRQAPLIVISGSEVRMGLQLDRSEFVDFALLLGTDFSQRIKNVGPQRALKFIREHGSIEKVIEREPQFPPRTPPNEYLAQVARARQVFQVLPPPPELGSLRPGEVDEDEMNKILRRYNLEREIPEGWEYHDALVGNYFQDDPAAS